MQVPIAVRPGVRAWPFPRLRTSVRAEVVIGCIAGLAVLYMVAAPLAMLLFSSIRATGNTLPFEATTFTLANYVKVFSSGLTYRLLLNTLWYAAGSLTLGLTLGVTFSWLFERTNIPGRTLLLTLIMTTLAVPGIVDGMAWVMLANPNNGVVNVVLRQLFHLGSEGPLDIYGVPGMIVVTGFSMVPSMYIMISGLFARMDPSLEEAGAMSGARFGTIVRRVTVPLLMPGLVAAAIYFFVVVSESFEVPAVLGMSQRIFVFSTLIYETTHPNSGLPDFGLASGYAMIQLLTSAGLIYLYGRATRNNARFGVVKGKGYRPRQVDLGPWRYVAFAAVLCYFALVTLTPFLVLLWTSFQPFFAVPSIAGLSHMSWSNYGKAFAIPGFRSSLSNTGLIGLFTVLTTLTLGSIVAWMAVRRPFRGSVIPDRLSFLVVATPSIVLGLALMFVYLWIPLPIYGTIVIIAIALSTRYLPFIVRLLSATLIQIHRELEESAHVSGASWPVMMAKIVVPLVIPTLWRGMLWVTAHTVREATLAVMLLTTSNLTFGAVLWLAWFHYTDIGMGAALSVCIVLVSGVLTFFVARTGLSSNRVESASSEPKGAAVLSPSVG